MIRSSGRHGVARRATLAIVGILTCFSGASISASSKNPGLSQPKTVVMIGASYARSWNVSALTDMQVINKGAGGEQTHEMLARFDRDVVASAPQAVVIWGFINDIFRSSPEEVEKKLIVSRENINKMIEKAKTKGITPILVTEVTLPIGDGWWEQIVRWVGSLRGRQSYQEYVNGHVLEMNRWIRRQAVEKKLTLLDFEKVLADSTGRRKPEYATQDGTHLSSAAYAALTNYVQRLKLGI